MAEADRAGMTELTGQTLKFDAPEGTVALQLDDARTSVFVNGSPASSSPTYATRVADGIYFVTWDGQPAGNHVVFNSHTMRVYDQILEDGSRAEVIYTATCFGTEGC